MQDDFNSAQTPAGQSTPAVAQQPAQPGQPRVPGHPLGVIGANAAPQGQPNPQAQGQTPWWAGKTRPYYGSPSVGTQTELDAQPPAAWPPAAPTQQPGRQLPPSGPKPPIYQPPGMPPLAPPVAPQPPAILPAPFPAQRAVTRVSAPAPRRASRPRVSAPAPAAPRPGRWRRWVPLPHTLLLLGVALLLLATYLPWGVDASGNLIMLPTAGVQSLPNQSGGTTAAQVAYNLITVVGGLSVAMLLSNAVLSGLHRLLGRGCFAKSFTALFYPILVALALALLIAEALAAGFGGISALAQVPVAQSYGVAGLGMAHYELGYYLWYTGIMVNVAGMLGELVVWRR
ncbi:MAG TPA: hypothetical protein VIG77_15725 [Ktedonobacterales bacterium]|jgi:hypothetical protein